MTKLISKLQPKAIFLMGPTASGKTTLATTLHRYLPVEIISVDSALIYRGMDIGTAKPNTDELVQTPHRLINICDPADTYSVADFCQDAFRELLEITNNGNIPLLVGGSMLYFKALLEGLSPLPPTNAAVRTYIKQEAQKNGWIAMHKKLQQIDPNAASRIHPNDLQRLSRALEVFFLSGSTLTELTKISGKSMEYRVYQFAIAPLNRILLYKRIEQRFYQMLDNGFEHEVNILFSRSDLHREMPSLRCIGYRQMLAYLAGEIDYEHMIFYGICATRQFAKRQMTWLRTWRNIYWLNSDKLTSALDNILKIVTA